jgi:RsiW-degrading membrane proteinase PrsW (M82 family)
MATSFILNCCEPRRQCHLNSNFPYNNTLVARTVNLEISAKSSDSKIDIIITLNHNTNQMYLLFLALAPALLIMMYVYFRDKYEKEPIGLVLKGFLLGAIIIFPVGFIENSIKDFALAFDKLPKAAYDGFIVAAATEEVFKFLMVFILIWRNPNFNEKFDGIVYAVSVSLGFATIENLFYVFSNNSMQVGLLRAFTAVPGHAIFGIVMGFYLGLARFSQNRKGKWLFMALFLPWLLHGIYDFLLMSGHPVLLVAFIPFLFFMYRHGLRRMKELNYQSVFNPGNINFRNNDENNFNSENS